MLLWCSMMVWARVNINLKGSNHHEHVNNFSGYGRSNVFYNLLLALGLILGWETSRVEFSARLWWKTTTAQPKNFKTPFFDFASMALSRKLFHLFFWQSTLEPIVLFFIDVSSNHFEKCFVFFILVLVVTFWTTFREHENSSLQWLKGTLFLMRWYA